MPAKGITSCVIRGVVVLVECKANGCTFVFFVKFKNFLHNIFNTTKPRYDTGLVEKQIVTTIYKYFGRFKHIFYACVCKVWRKKSLQSNISLSCICLNLNEWITNKLICFGILTNVRICLPITHTSGAYYIYSADLGDFWKTAQINDTKQLNVISSNFYLIARCFESRWSSSSRVRANHLFI